MLKKNYIYNRNRKFVKIEDRNKQATFCKPQDILDVFIGVYERILKLLFLKFPFCKDSFACGCTFYYDA